MKTIYDFHYNIVKKHIIELEEKNETTIKSGFLFDIFKKQYTTSYNVTKIQSDTTFVFHWSGTRSDKKCKYPNPIYYILLIRVVLMPVK